MKRVAVVFDGKRGYMFYKINGSSNDGKYNQMGYIADVNELKERNAVFFDSVIDAGNYITTKRREAYNLG